MDMRKKETLFAALTARQAAAEAESETLKACGREDEANLKKAERNIYGIFAQLLHEMQTDADYAAQFERLQTAWEQARALAAAHEDHDRMSVEDVKLDALSKARALYQAMSEEKEHE